MKLVFLGAFWRRSLIRKDVRLDIGERPRRSKLISSGTSSRLKEPLKASFWVVKEAGPMDRASVRSVGCLSFARLGAPVVRVLWCCSRMFRFIRGDLSCEKWVFLRMGIPLLGLFNGIQKEVTRFLPFQGVFF